MNLVFLGTPEFAVPSLNALLAQNFQISCVITRPDAIRKRGKEISPSPIKEVAQANEIPVLETKTITPDICAQVKDLKPDVAVVVAFGALLPPEFLDIPAKGTINVHASLLPRWRGAAPIERSLLAGDEKTGVSIMRVEEGLDSGPYCAQTATLIGDKSSSTLAKELAQMGGELLVHALEDIEQGSVRWTEQDEQQVSLAPKISKEEMFLSPKKTLRENLRIIQASSKRAPAKLLLSLGGGKNIRIRVVEARDALSAKLEPSEASIQHNCLFLGAHDGTFEAVRLIPEGKKEMSGEAFVRGLTHAESLRWGQECFGSTYTEIRG